MRKLIFVFLLLCARNSMKTVHLWRRFYVLTARQSEKTRQLSSV